MFSYGPRDVRWPKVLEYIGLSLTFLSDFDGELYAIGKLVKYFEL